MCGRYAATANPGELVEELEVEADCTAERSRSLTKHAQNPPAGEADYNMAPSKQAPVVLTRRDKDDPDGDPIRQLRLLSWGLVPPWAKDPSMGMRMINARAETVLDKPSYAKAALRRRCLVPAAGWYEWQKSPTVTTANGKPRKQPFYTVRADGHSVVMAGLYEFWRDKNATSDDDAWVVSYTILTTDAEPGLDRIHDRQPVVLERDEWADWLNPDNQDPDAVAHTLGRKRSSGRFEAWPVRTLVNTTANNSPELIAPAPEAELKGVVDPTTGEVINA